MMEKRRSRGLRRLVGAILLARRRSPESDFASRRNTLAATLGAALLAVISILGKAVLDVPGRIQGALASQESAREAQHQENMTRLEAIRTAVEGRTAWEARIEGVIAGRWKCPPEKICASPPPCRCETKVWGGGLGLQAGAPIGPPPPLEPISPPLRPAPPRVNGPKRPEDR